MRTVVITGVSRGLGAALFDELAARGDRLIAVGRTFTEAQQELAAGEPDRVTLHRADLAAFDPSALDGTTGLAGLAGATELALVHNAGAIEPIGAVGTLPADRVAATVALNLTAPMLLTNAFLAAVPQSATDVRIVFVSSGAAQRVIGGWGVYCASKAGGEMFFTALAAQLDGDPRFTVSNVNPGVMDTRMQAAIRGAARSGAYFPDRERFVGLYERGELPTPAEVAKKIVAAHLTGK